MKEENQDGSGKALPDASRQGREIKFRAWDKENGIMHHFDKMLMMDNGVFFENSNFNMGAGHNDDETAVIQQWTGLKDKNGREIYEGDILNPERYSKMSYYRAPVVFKNGAFRLEGPLVSKGDIGRSLAIGHRARNRWEIIGNIYENPELLASPASAPKGQP